jgi:tetratricopeptide (TPR) repeat protein
VAAQETEIVDLFARALAIDPDHPAALTVLGERYRGVEWRWEDAETLLRRALAIDPNYADAHTAYAYLLAHMGRCGEALEHARAAARLDPVFTWRRLAEARVLKCLGRLEESDALYRRLLDEDRELVFVASEMHYNHMSRHEPAKLRALAAHIRDDLWADETMPPAMAQITARMEAGADALEGDPDAFLALLEADAALLAAQQDRPTREGRSPTDALWTLAIEFAAAGAHDRAVDTIENAIANGALYVPETMPYGACEFTPEVRADPRYQAVWRSDPRLVALMEIRLKSVRARQMAGVLPNGRSVRPRG